MQLTIEVSCNDEGIIYNPIIVNGVLIKELGMFDSNGQKFWVVPKPKQESLFDSVVKNECWMLRSNRDDFQDEIYFVGFNLRTMCDIDENETNSEAVTAKYSQHQARIFTSKDKAEQAAAILNVINPQAKWVVISINC